MSVTGGVDIIADGTVVPTSTLTHELCLELMQTSEWSEIIPL